MGKGNGTSRASSSSSPRGLSASQQNGVISNGGYEKLDRKGMRDFLYTLRDNWGFPSHEENISKLGSGDYRLSIRIPVNVSYIEVSDTFSNMERRAVDILDAHKSDLDSRGISYKIEMRTNDRGGEEIQFSFAQKHVRGYKKSSNWAL